MIAVGPDKLSHKASVGRLTRPNRPDRKRLLDNRLDHRHEVSHSYQVVDRQREGKHPPDPQDPSMPSLAHQPDSLQPPEDLLHPFALSLTDLVSRMSGRSAIQSAALLLRHVRGYLHPTQLLNKVPHIVVLISSQRYPMISPDLITHHHGGFPLCRARRLAQIAVNHQTIAVLHQRMPQITKLGLLPLGFLIQPSLWVGAGLVRIVGSFLSPKLHARIATRVPRASRLILFLKALLPGPRFDQCAIHREVLVGQKPLLPRLRMDLFKKLLRDVPSQKTLPVLTEYRGVPHPIVHVEPHKPPKKQIVIELLHEQPLAPQC